jgi:membrane-bound acyltransferase YfiQ involved in biofilm formation
MGLFLFVFLAFIGEFVMKWRVFSKVFTRISGISYACFLLHHRVIADILTAWNPAEPWRVLLLLVATVVWILCLSKALTLVNQAVVRSLDRYLSPLFCRKKKPNEIKE